MISSNRKYLTNVIYSANVNTMFKLASQHHVHILPERRG